MIPAPWPAMIAVAGAYLAMFGVGELLLRRGVARPETTRRLDHVLGGVIALSLPVAFDSPWPVVALGAAFVAFLGGARLIGLLRSVHEVTRPTVGAFLYPVAIAVTFVAAADRPMDYTVAVVSLATADVAAGLVGGRVGRHRYGAWGHPKSWEGTLAALAVTGVLSTLILSVGGADPGAALGAGLLVAVVIALVEGALPWGLDNLGIPVAALLCLAVADSAVGSAGVLIGAAALLGAAILVPVPAARSRPDRTPHGAPIDAP